MIWLINICVHWSRSLKCCYLIPSKHCFLCKLASPVERHLCEFIIFQPLEVPTHDIEQRLLETRHWICFKCLVILGFLNVSPRKFGISWVLQVKLRLYKKDQNLLQRTKGNFHLQWIIANDDVICSIWHQMAPSISYSLCPDSEPNCTETIRKSLL